MAGVVMAIDALLPPLAAPIRLGILVPAGGVAFLGALLLCARGTLKELIGLVLRRAPPAPAPA
ncbi:MAG: lipopolysaccharide biosynthesis protein, partial [Sphingobium sp.]